MADDKRTWDWGTIEARLLAGLYVIAIAQLQRFDPVAAVDNNLETLRLQAEELLKKTDPA